MVLEKEKESPGFFKRVQRAVKRVPKGKVVTYGQIAKMLGVKDARLVGWALHRNKDKSLPCHRVINKDGRLASGYVFGGISAQRAKLKREGIKFVDDTTVDLKLHIFDF